MRLSEHERRVLAELEGNLMDSDPRFARRLAGEPGPALRPSRLPSGAPPRPRRMLRLLGHWRG